MPEEPITSTAYLMMGALTVLAGVIALLYKAHLDDVKSRDSLREAHTKEIKDLLVKAVESQSHMAMVVANNTKVMERYIDKI